MRSDAHGIGQAVLDLGPEFRQLVAAPGVSGLAGDAIATAIIFATEVGDADRTKGIEAVFALLQRESWSSGQADGQGKQTSFKHAVMLLCSG
ncbi:hypothetical protein PSEUDO9AZ_40634 [Pseudomonas sp. 9AZ]|nr:hypothetical protein PSEUDO9AZ_40634 [Pseudomonas sp. 9AZ]